MNTQRRKNTYRKIGFDYTNPCIYFITICTKDMQHWFGDIHSKTMCLNKIGSIAWRKWQWICERYTYIEPFTFMVMPNHIHILFEIQGSVGAGSIPPVRQKEVVQQIKTVGVGFIPPEKQDIKSISEIIRGYKARITREVHKQGISNFSFHRSFHDHIIRNEKELEKIYWYIAHNPIVWHLDRYNDDV